jgi:pimeloyl-ACP methyl ester carboxylesterase
MAMYYLDFLDALDGPPVHLVGHSLGGWIAAELAVRNAARLRSLTLICPAGLRVKGLTCGDNFIWSREEYARNLFHDQALAEEALAHVPTDEEADIDLTNRYMAVKLGWEPRWFSPALETWLHRIRIPTLMVWGRDDKLFPSAYAKAWAAQIPDIEVEIIPECGHRPQLEKADVAAQRVLAFLGRQS